MKQVGGTLFIDGNGLKRGDKGWGEGRLRGGERREGKILRGEG